MWILFLLSLLCVFIFDQDQDEVWTLILIEFVMQGCLNDHLNENRLTAPEVAGRSDAPAHTTIDDPPQAVWQKIVSAALKQA